MTDMQTSLPLLIVRPSILNPVMHFSTKPLTGEMKCPTSHTFALRIPFHLPKCWCHKSTKLHQAFWSSSWVNTWLDLPWMIWYDPLHIITWPLWSINLDLARSSPSPPVHRCQILPKLLRLAVHRFKVLTCPSPLQPVPQAKLCLDLLHFGHMTHVMSHM